MPSTTVRSAPATTDTCDGQLVEADDHDPPLSTCFDWSDFYNVSSGTLEHVTGSDIWSCFIKGAICLPKPCEIDIVSGDNTCEALAAKYSTDDSPVSLIQFLAWNPYLHGTCEDVYLVQRVCKGPPGGRFKPSGVIAAPTGPGDYFTTVQLHRPAFIWDDCTNLWLDYDVCVAPVSTTAISEDGTCGPSHSNTICEGSSFGDCCCTSGYCGIGLDYCSPGNCVSGGCEPNNGATINGTCDPDWGYTTCIAAQSTEIAAMGRNIVGQDNATPGIVTQTLEVPALMESVALALRGTRLVLVLSLETAARSVGTVGALTTTAVLGIVTLALVNHDQEPVC
ncbi:hypothetical protein FE257_003358 [Aspergillus nanangensis]|uniref:Chitin-binding type-1 domain-containing protein n=1 Tax=Aspergillus nanangensis TaxID=2582783 RepID=A0AAD4CU78_ASPNN|nr:hypothetical protein FE257_003358 [Aspergillus nanangensis]